MSSSIDGDIGCWDHGTSSIGCYKSCDLLLMGLLLSATDLSHLPSFRTPKLPQAPFSIGFGLSHKWKLSAFQRSR